MSVTPQPPRGRLVVVVDDGTKPHRMQRVLRCYVEADERIVAELSVLRTELHYGARDLTTVTVTSPLPRVEVALNG